MVKLSFCQNHPPMRESFWRKDSLITFVFFNYVYFDIWPRALFFSSPSIYQNNCVSIIFQPILKNLPNHKSQTWFSFQVIVVTADMSNARVVLNAFQNPTFVMATMTAETIPVLMNKVAGNSLFLPFWCLCFAMRCKSNSEMRNSF